MQDKDNDNEQWNTNIKDWQKIPKEVMALMVSQSEKSLSGKINSLELSTIRGDKLLGIYIPICTALLIYVLPRITEIFSNYLPTTAALGLFVSAIGLYFCWKNMKSFKQCDLGFFPKDIVRTEYVDNNFSDDDKLTALSLSICRNTQLKCDLNENVISERSNNNQNAIKALILLPLCPVIAAIILAIF